MLNRIEITGLYGHYTYDLPLSSGQRKDICFLTGPNGYGKSTILDLVYAFIKADAKTLVGIPYDTITFYLKDYKVNLKQERYEVEGDPNDDSSRGIRGTGTFIHKIFPHISLNKSHRWAA